MQVFIEQYDPSIEDEFRRSDVVGYKKINTREQLSTYLKRYLPEVDDEFVSTVCNSPRNVVVQVPGNFKHVCPSTGRIYKISLNGSYLPDGAEEELTYLEAEGYVHFYSGSISYMEEGTLCGIGCDNPEITDTEKNIVDCPQCIRILKLLRTVKFKERAVAAGEVKG